MIHYKVSTRFGFPQTFEEVYEKLAQSMFDAKSVDTGHWQAISNVPQTQTRELQNVVLEYDIPEYVDLLQAELSPNLPWAEDQFQERVAGEPVNPGVTYKDWPWYRGNVEQHQTEQEERFSHTYMERFWPRRAAGGQYYEVDHGEPDDHHGIRYRYGDLMDVMNLLLREPFTRQAFLPIWFPEDTGAHEQQRVPCTLGYHFMLRDGKLHVFYPIRSCDLLRHFRDDVYMAARLCQWVIEELADRSVVTRDEGFDWDGVRCGDLTMHMVSLHVFEGDLPALARKYAPTS